jgi:hypothetical protein
MPQYLISFEKGSMDHIPEGDCCAQDVRKLKGPATPASRDGR